jgi:hypothetical protein
MQDAGSFERRQEGSLGGPIVDHPDGTDSDDERQESLDDELASEVVADYQRRTLSDLW